jgi:hypothetical protein
MGHAGKFIKKKTSPCETNTKVEVILLSNQPSLECIFLYIQYTSEVHVFQTSFFKYILHTS